MVVKNEDRTVIQCTVVGDGMVGKTCLSLAFCGLSTHGHPVSTQGEYVATVFENYAGKTVLNGDEYTIGVFDSAGQHDYASLREFTYKESEVFIVCYSVVDRDSFDSIRDFWVPEMKKNMDRKKPIILVATQTDLRNSISYDSDIPISSEEGYKLCKEIGAVSYTECSVQEINTVKKVFHDVTEAGLKYRKRKLNIVHKLLGK